MCNFTNVFFKLILRIDILGNSCETGLQWVPQNPIDDEATLVQVMALYRQATSHYWNVDPDLRLYMASLGHNELKQLST